MIRPGRLRQARRYFFGVALATLAPRAPAIAQATLTEQQLEEGASPQAAKKSWDVTLGVGVAGVTTYDGGERYHARPVPLVTVNYRDRLFLGPGGLGATLVHWQGLRLGPVIGFGGGRKQSDDPHLSGLGDVQPAVMAGLFASYDLGPVRLGGTLRQAVTHDADGLQGKAGIAYRGRLDGGRMLFSAGPELDFGNGRYERTYFGVTPAQAAASGLAPFTPEGGIKDVGLALNLTYRWTDHVLLRSFGAVRELLGDTARSPVVQSKTQGLLGLGIAYHF